MKKVSILSVCVFAISVLFVSCNKDEPTTVEISGDAKIEGKWNFSNSTATSSGITIPYSTPYFKNEEGCPNKDYIELLSGGIVKNGDYSNSPSACALTVKDGTWSQSGSNLTIAVANTSFNGTFSIASLSTTELILKIDGTYGGQSGTFNLTFTK